MRWKSSPVLLSGLMAAALALAAAPVEAQTKKKPVVYGNAGTHYTIVDEDGRTRTRIIVQKRSFLDGGTEVLPGQRKYTDYVFPPGYSPTSAIDGTVGGGIRSPLPGPWDLPGRDNPYPW
ncbi:MAG: hypothetical protein WD073_10195 [Xanthobacteraceae bacterium]